MKAVIRSFVDGGRIIEPHEHYGEKLIVCFARLDGRTVGIIANQPMALAGSLDVDASDKATRFIRFCDSFNIRSSRWWMCQAICPGATRKERNHPARRETAVVLLGGHRPEDNANPAEGHRRRLPRYVQPRPRLRLRARVADREIAVMEPPGAANIIYRKAITSAADPDAARKEKTKSMRICSRIRT